jgi:hypothetical protein
MNQQYIWICSVTRHITLSLHLCMQCFKDYVHTLIDLVTQSTTYHTAEECYYEYALQSDEGTGVLWQLNNHWENQELGGQTKVR